MSYSSIWCSYLGAAPTPYVQDTILNLPKPYLRSTIPYFLIQNITRANSGSDNLNWEYRILPLVWSRRGPCGPHQIGHVWGGNGEVISDQVKFHLGYQNRDDGKTLISPSAATAKVDMHSMYSSINDTITSIQVIRWTATSEFTHIYHHTDQLWHLFLIR